MVTQNSWDAPYPNTDGTLLIGKTSAHAPVLGTLTAGSGINVVNGSGSITLSSFNAVNENNIYYVGKHGSDSNTGLNIENAFLTFGHALTVAASMSPSSSNIFAIECLDAGTYTENITTVSYVNIRAPNATLAGTMSLAANGNVLFAGQNIATGTTGITQASGGTTTVQILSVTAAGTGNWVSCSSGTVDLFWSNVSLVSGTAINATGGTVYLNGGTINMSGAGKGVATGGATASTVAGTIAAIVGTGTGTAVSAAGAGTVSLSVQTDINTGDGLLVSSASCILNVSAQTISSSGIIYEVLFGKMNLICSALSGGGTRQAALGGVAQVTIANPLGTAGQIWQSNGGPANDPGWATLSAGTGISISNTTGSITIAATGDEATWGTTASTTIAASPFTGYGCTAGTLATITLPATSNVGDTYEVVAMGAGGWKIAYNAGQNIIFGTSTTTTTTGSLASTNTGDAVKLVCLVPNTTFYVLSAVGDLTIA